MEIFAGSTTLRVWARSIILLLLLGGALAAFQASAIGQQNPIQVENARPGTTDWQLLNPAEVASTSLSSRPLQDETVTSLS